VFEDSCFNILTKQISTAIEKKQKYALFKNKAHILLNKKERFKKSFNYGNAIHKAHTILGLIELNSNNLKKAKKHLELSALHKGSPQLNSFGPNCSLAYELLKKDQNDAVINYLNLTLKFWNSKEDTDAYMQEEDTPEYRVHQWIKKIKKKKIPDFGSHFYY
jgi:hypothetical protein